MKTVEDLIEWLEANNYSNCAKDILKMQNNQKYADKCNYAGDSQFVSLSDQISGLFTWDKSKIDKEIWIEISEKLAELDI